MNRYLELRCRKSFGVSRPTLAALAVWIVSALLLTSLYAPGSAFAWDDEQIDHRMGDDARREQMTDADVLGPGDQLFSEDGGPSLLPQSSNSPVYDAGESGLGLDGVDVSAYQPGFGDSDWTNYQFAIVKASEGTYYTNDKLAGQASKVQADGKLLGFYHYASGSDATAEAEYFLNRVRSYIGEAVLALDWEDGAVSKGPSYAKTFLDYVYEHTGVKPLIYMSQSVTTSYDWSEVVEAGYGLWVAQYLYRYDNDWLAKNPASAASSYGYDEFNGYSEDPYLSGGTGAWDEVVIYQYSSKGRVGFSNGRLDINKFYGTEKDWNDLAGGKPTIKIPDWDLYEGNAWPYGDTVYTIRSARDTHYCVEVPNASTENAANVALHERNPYPQHRCQQWVFRYNHEGEDGTYSIYNLYSGMALDNYGASTENNGNIVQHEPNGSDAQRWYVHDCGDGSVAFQNKASGLWLDIQGDVACDGANIQQYENVGTDNLSQKFYLTPFYDANFDGETTIPSEVLEGSYFYLHSMMDQNLVLDVEGISQDNGALIQLCPINAGSNQQFRFVANGDGSYRIVARHSGKAIEMPSLSVRLGEQLHQWSDDGVAQRSWFVRQAGAQNVVAFRNVWSDLYMHVRDDDAYGGAPVEQYRYCVGDCERFAIVPVPNDALALTVGEGEYEIVPADGEGLAVTADGEDSGSTLSLAVRSEATGQRFRVTVDGKRHYIEAAGGNRLAVRDGSRVSGTEACLATAENVNVQRWFLDDAGGGAFYIRNGKTDLILGLAGGEAAEGARIVERLSTGDANQRFLLRRVDGAPDYSYDGWVDLPDDKKGYAKGGKLVTGWLDLDKAKYYFNDKGEMLVGWNNVEVDGKTMHYYFHPSGNLARDTWATIDGNNYYFRPSGNMATGWATIIDNGVKKYYYFEEDGTLVKDTWRDIENDEGVTNHYYFRPSGSMATEWAEVGGKMYFFRPSGNMATGFADVPDDQFKRYFEDDGTMVTGWREINGNRYYFRGSGAMQTGSAVIDGVNYTFSGKGVLVDWL